MRRTTLIALAVVTAPVTLAALLLPSGGGGGGSTKAEAGGLVFPKLNEWIQSATKLTVQGATATVTLERKAPAKDVAEALGGEGWTVPDKGGYPVPAGTMKGILGGLVGLQIVAPKTERVKLYHRLDLDLPGPGSDSHELSLVKADGADILKLIIGKHKYDTLNQGRDGIYIRKPDDIHTWLAQPAITLPFEELAWIDRKILDIDADTIKEIEVTPTGGKPLVVTRDKKGDPLTIRDLPKDAKLKQEQPGETIAGALRYLDLDDVKPSAQVSAPVIGTVHFVTLDGLTGDVFLEKQDGTWITVAVKGSGDAAKQAEEIAKRTDGWTYRIADARAGTLETKLADLLEPPEKPEKPEPPRSKAAPAR